MRKNNNIRRKAFIFLMAFVLVFTSLPLELDTAYAGTKGTLVQKNLDGNYQLKSNKYMQIYTADYQEHEVYIGSATDAGMPFKRFEIDNFLVYCMEHGVTQKSIKLEKIQYDKADFYEAYMTGYNGKSLKYAIDNIFNVLLYAPVTGNSGKVDVNDLYELGFKNYKDYGKHAAKYTEDDWIAATQMLVWEAQQLFRDKEFDRVDNGLSYQDSWRGTATTPIKRGHYTNNITGTAAIDIYNFMASEIKKGMQFDRALASREKSKPKITVIPVDATFPHTTEKIPAGSYAGEYKAYDDKGKELDAVDISFVEAGKDSYYEITVANASVLNKTIVIKHDHAAAKRAERYLSGPGGSKYRQYFWEYPTTDSHTQGFVSGLYDPVEAYMMLSQGPEPNPIDAGDCTPPDVEYFPTISMPITKVDANVGWDGDNTTPMGDAGLDATFTLERQIGGGAWQTIDTITLDDFGREVAFQDQPFLTYNDLDPYLTESGTITGCPHIITDTDGNPIGVEHPGSRQYKRRDWDVTVNYRITEYRPDGRYIDPDDYAGVRTYQFTYHAEAYDTCTNYCDTLPWSPITYTFSYGNQVGYGAMHTTGIATAPSEDLICDTETFVNDEFRGDLQVIKSNETYDPFKDSGMGGARTSENSLWTIELKNASFEGEQYVHLDSLNPTVVAGGTNQYVASRDVGEANGPDAATALQVGTNGVFILKDLPYGEYIVTEYSADNPMYVIERFEVDIQEHNGNGGGPVNATGLFGGYGQAGINDIGSAAAGAGDYWNSRYDANVRDKVISNVIKLEKTDAETGKTIRMAGTKVYIRFKGNPDYTDEVNQQLFGTSGTQIKDIYNRYLPNAESINSKSTNYTFELDENGEIDIPYQLPYGRYEISEWLLPEGYYIGQYDENGIGTTYWFEDVVEESERAWDEGFLGSAAGRMKKPKHILYMTQTETK